MNRIRLVTALVGSGFPTDSFERAMEWEPDVIACQGTSSDPGPYYYATHENYFETISFRKDLEILTTRAKAKGIPFIGSFGGGGTNEQLEGTLKVLDEIARDRGRMRVAVIQSDVPKAHLRELIRSGVQIPRLVPHERLSEFLTEADVDAAMKVVAQIGAEPIVKALELDVDAVVTGRCIDIGVLAAVPLKAGLSKAAAFFAGKLMEGLSTAAEPLTTNDLLCGEVSDRFIDLFPPNPSLRCTPISVAAHSVYERHDAFQEANPGGVLYVDDATYVQLDERTVRVSGGRWIDAPYTVKIEGVREAGHRYLSIAGIRDDVVISHLDEILEGAKSRVTRAAVAAGVNEADFRIGFRVYGRNAIMGRAEPTPTPAHEVCVLTDVVAKKKQVARMISAQLKATIVHWGFDGLRTTAGNVAFPFSPSDFDGGMAYAFNVWHLLPLTDPCALFPAAVIDFPRSGR